MDLNEMVERESKGRKKRFEKVRRYCRGDVEGVAEVWWLRWHVA